MRLKSVTRNFSHCGLQYSTGSPVTLSLRLPLNQIERRPMFLPVLFLTASWSNSVSGVRSPV